jgi:hypothetical protein
MDEILHNRHTSSILHQPYFTRYGIEVCAKKQDIDMDYQIVIFLNNKICRSSLWLNFNYFKWPGKYYHDFVAFFIFNWLNNIMCY